MMPRYVPILGTHAWSPTDNSRQWWHYKSPFATFLRSRGVLQAHPETPYIWSGDVDGIPFAGNDWEASGRSLHFYLSALPYDQRNIVAHSHGGQVVAYAAQDTPIRSLITVGTPVRRKEKALFEAALQAGQIGIWVHVYDKGGDRTQWLGQLFDGRWFGRRAFELPGMTDLPLEGIGHSGILNDPAKFALWVEHGLIDVLVTGPDVETAA